MAPHKPRKSSSIQDTDDEDMIVYDMAEQIELPKKNDKYFLSEEYWKNESWRQGLDTSCSIFTAEAVAIYRALQLIDSTMPRKYCIYTDSMIVLEALESYHDRCHPVVCTILDITSRLYSKGFDIVFCWLPSHVGIIGNEQADSAAKSATHLPLAVPLSDMKRVIMHHIFKIWQESWSQQLDNKLHSVKPVIGAWPVMPMRRTDVKLTRLRIGHTSSHTGICCLENVLLNVLHAIKSTVAPVVFQRVFAYHRSQYSRYSAIYTDGSKRADYVGCGVVIEDILHEALENYHDGCDPVVCTILDITSRLYSKGFDIVFCWLPSHVGIIGNEQADNAAKSATTHLPLAVPLSDMKRVIMHHIFNIWQESWSQQLDNKLHSVKPVIGAWPVMPMRRTDVKLTRLRIGHTRFTHRHLLFGERAPESRVGSCANNPKTHSLTHSTDCNLEPKCVNCLQPHPSDSKICPKWKIEKQIQEIKTTKKISYPEARKLIVPQLSQTYAQAAKSSTLNNSTQTDENITKIKCPPLKLLAPLSSKQRTNIPTAVTTSSSAQTHLLHSISSKTSTTSDPQPPTPISKTKGKIKEQPSQLHRPRKDNIKIDLMRIKPPSNLKKNTEKNTSVKSAREQDSPKETSPVSKKSRRRKTFKVSDAMETDANPSDTDYVTGLASEEDESFLEADFTQVADNPLKGPLSQNDVKDIIRQYHPVCVALQENFLKSCHTTKIRRYGCLRKDTEGPSVSGGVCIFTSLDVPSSALPLHTSLQAVAVRIHSTSLITVCCLYLPPNTAIHQHDLNNLINQLPTPFVILGDFNGHSTLWGSGKTNPRGRPIEQVLSDHCLCLLNHEEPTYFHEPTRSFHTVDLAICSPSLLPHLNLSVEKDLYNSDHFPLILSHDSDPGGKTFPPTYSFSRADWALFTQLAVITDVMVKTDSVDTAVQEVTNVLIAAADFSIPKSSSHSFRHYKPWWNADCQTAYKNQRRLWGIFRRYPTTENLLAFKKAKANARRVRRRSQRQSWIRYVSSLTSSTSSKQLWKKVKAANGIYREFSFPILQTSNSLFSSPVEIANILGETFQSVSSAASYNSRFLEIKRQAERTPINFSTRSFFHITVILR
ncbi:putative RNA-directed DNA polymerase from transposon X-element [Trichonephila clavipes]|nr:putative RNA-directed DNA polymerase from transposon X-element [Trichonephila clavipes]